jgi:putative tryptophan/tyrosine transport system substrate-binding protein
MFTLRRWLLIAIAGGALAAPPITFAQTTQKVFRVGLLSGAGRTPDGNAPGLFRESLRGLGYLEGRNIAYEARFAEGDAERLPGLAAELVGLKVDVIATLGGPATAAAKGATSRIPIVMARAAGDAVATGWISSLARPGGNVTGLTDESVQLSAKRMELLKEAVPKAGLIAVLWNADDDGMTLRYREIEKAARILKVNVQPIGVRRAEDFNAAFSAMARTRPDAMFLVADPLTTMNSKKVIEFAATQRIPAMYENGFQVRDGGLMAYGTNIEDDFRRAAVYVDRILKGTRPAELPAEQPTRHYLTINAKTAATLGLTLPPALLFRADQLYQ